MATDLPDSDLVEAQRSVVKMHGGHYGLRADFSLDTTPSFDDINKFISYLSFNNSELLRNSQQNQNNLLIIGVSGRDSRTVHLICEAMIKLNKLKVFWLCYNKERVSDLRKSFKNALSDLIESEIDIDKLITGDDSRLIISVAPDLSLFLFELYQNIFLSLPPGGAHFHSVWALPPEPNMHILKMIDEKTNQISDSFKTEQALFQSEKIKKITKEIEFSSKKKLVNILLYGNYGISSLGSLIFYHFLPKYHCVWINLGQNFNSYDFAFSIIDTIAFQFGITELIPAYIRRGANGDFSKLKDLFYKLINYSPRRTIIFINAREFPGNPKSKAYKEWKKNDYKFCCELINTINQFSPQKTDSFFRKHDVQFIIVGWNRCLSEKFLEKKIHLNKNLFGKLKKIKVPIPKNSTIEKDFPENIPSFYDKVNFPNPELFGIFDDVIKKIADKNISKSLRDIAYPNYDSTRLHNFIFALSFFQRPCYQSVLNSWIFLPFPRSLSIGDDNDEIRYFEAKVYLEVLRKCNVIRDDDGQFVFMHSSHNEKAQKWYNDQKKEFDFNNKKAHCNFGIAEWYMKLYRASGDVVAACDSINHRLQCIKSASTISISIERNRLLDISILEIEMTIESIKKSALSTFHTATMINQFNELTLKLTELIQSHFFNKGKINFWRKQRLETIIEKINLLKSSFEHQQGNYQDVKSSKKNNTFHGQKDSSTKINKKGKINRKDIKSESPWKDAKLHTNSRQYDLAKDEMNIISGELFHLSLKELFIGDSFQIRDRAIRWIYNEFNFACRKDRETALHACQKLFEFAVQFLRRLQFLFLFFAQIEHYLAPTQRTNDEKNFLEQAEKCYIFSAEIMHFVLNTNFLNREKAYLQTNTGILLSRMQRHHEAYRRYNEAYSYLNFVTDKDIPYEYSIVDLRRGETFLLQIEQKIDIPAENESAQPDPDDIAPKDKQNIGLLFDAISSVEQAENRMRGTSINVWWYCWMFEMQLNICLNITKLRDKIEKYATQLNLKDKYDLFSRCRDCEKCGNRFLKYLQDAFEIVNDDVLRISRYLFLAHKYQKYFLKNDTGESGNNNKKNPNEIEAIIEAGKNRLNDLLKNNEYYHRVEKYAKNIIKDIEQDSTLQRTRSRKVSPAGF